ncbi:MAG: glycoside hydrolase family 31 protein [Bacteroidota bacterium]|nr:glycoside hydrolase family 31 protein [Bacteroidota bacterium]
MLINEPLDISEDFFQWQNELFVAGHLKEFDPGGGKGLLQWQYHRWINDRAFNTGGRHLKKTEQREEFWREQEVNPVLDFSVFFISENTIRLRMKTKKTGNKNQPSFMLVNEPVNPGIGKMTKETNRIIYSGAKGSLIIQQEPWKLEIVDNRGRPVMSTLALDWLDQPHPKSIPFCFLKRAADDTQSVAASFASSPGEKIVGCGESFTPLDKSGQKLILYATDAQSTATKKMYKPIPFFLSNKGYGLFVHTSAPVTMDLGFTHRGSNTIYSGDDELDLFIFLGSPKEILHEYTSLTGRSPLPPLWSFGLWMSRFTYRSGEEVRNIAAGLRQHHIPCDVIHIDAGWFNDGINCDYEFNRQNFHDPAGMMNEAREHGFRISLWQLPYFTSSNSLFKEITEKELCIKDQQGNIPADDIILDLSNPATIEWYRDKIRSLLQLGVSVIKGDFGEAAPLEGQYYSGRSGFHEHNLYPLRYNKILHDITYETKGEHIIWARSAWAGSQRYPLHWGGDPEVSDIGMAGTLSGGLSLGLSGFSFWSHDIGGFFAAPKEELFLRWAFFGLLSSHSRVHGFPPREPWEFSPLFLNTFRNLVELRYRLMPYIYSQAAWSSENGLPLLRALAIEYPHDPVAWTIEDQYFLGSDMLVAPLLENTRSRIVYLPKGKWINYFSHTVYEGNAWVTIDSDDIPGILLIRSGSIIPHIGLAQSTEWMDWNKIFLGIYAGDEKATGIFYDPAKKEMTRLTANKKEDDWILENRDINSKRFTLQPYNE